MNTYWTEPLSDNYIKQIMQKSIELTYILQYYVQLAHN